jgi:hypothetical protein
LNQINTNFFKNYSSDIKKNIIVSNKKSKVSNNSLNVDANANSNANVNNFSNEYENDNAYNSNVTPVKLDFLTNNNYEKEKK